MSKKTVTVTAQGVRESISGNSQELPSSVEFKVQGSNVLSLLYVAKDTTGSINGHNATFLDERSLLILPQNPADGETIKVYTSGELCGISGTHSIDSIGNAMAVDLSSSVAGAVTEDDFMFSSAAGVWIVPLTNLSTGTYSF